MTNADKKLMTTSLKRLITPLNQSEVNCKHRFIHVSNSGWWGCETIIYCEKCGVSKIT